MIIANHLYIAVFCMYQVPVTLRTMVFVDSPRTSMMTLTGFEQQAAPTVLSPGLPVTTATALCLVRP